MMNIASMLEKADQYFKNQDFKQAIDTYTLILQQQPDFPTIHFRIGAAYYYLKDFDHAESFLKKAMHYDPEDALSLFKLGMVRFEKHDREGSDNYFEQMIAKSPDKGKAAYEIGMYLLEQKQYEYALNYFNAALNQGYAMDTVYYNMGLLEMDRDDNEQAIACFNKALEVNPEKTDAANWIGTLYYKGYDYETARRYFKDIIEKDSSYHYAYYNMGLTFEAQNIRSKAAYFYRQALRIKPDYKSAKNALKGLGVDIIDISRSMLAGIIWGGAVGMSIWLAIEYLFHFYIGRQYLWAAGFILALLVARIPFAFKEEYLREILICVGGGWYVGAIAWGLGGGIAGPVVLMPWYWSWVAGAMAGALFLVASLYLPWNYHYITNYLLAKVLPGKLDLQLDKIQAWLTRRRC